MTTGERIKYFRKERGLTQKELAEKLGIPYQSIYQWESGKRTPKFNTVAKIAAALEIPIEQLLAGELSKTSFYESVGAFLKDFRIHCGYTQQEFADAIGNSKSTIQKYEKGQVEIPDRVFRKIEEVTGVYIPGIKAIGGEKFSYYELTLTPSKRKLLNLVDQLNPQGQEKAIEQVELVARVPEYRADQEHEDKEKRPHT